MNGHSLGVDRLAGAGFYRDAEHLRAGFGVAQFGIHDAQNRAGLQAEFIAHVGSFFSGDHGGRGRFGLGCFEHPELAAGLAAQLLAQSRQRENGVVD